MKLAFHWLEEGDILKFTYYVLNYNHNAQKVEPFNVFCNISVQEYTEKEVKEYLHSPENYVYKSFDGQEEIYGFDGLVKEIDNIIKWQEWGRFEYELSCGYAFETDCSKLQKFDTYTLAHMNIEMVVREVIRQYKQQKKEEMDGE